MEAGLEGPIGLQNYLNVRTALVGASQLSCRAPWASAGAGVWATSAAAAKPSSALRRSRSGDGCEEDAWQATLSAPRFDAAAFRKQAAW